MLGLREEVIEFEINPDRAYALSLRGIAREAALGFDAPYSDPAHRDAPAPTDDGYPVVVDDPLGCPVFAARIVRSPRMVWASMTAPSVSTTSGPE